jgi:hypothetical protein
MGTVHATPSLATFALVIPLATSRVLARLPSGSVHPAATAAPEPAEPEPAPFEPAPFEPAAFEPAPFEPAPFEPAAFEPAPFEPAPFEPAPFEPAPFEPGPFEPAPFGLAAAPGPGAAGVPPAAGCAGQLAVCLPPLPLPPQPLTAMLAATTHVASAASRRPEPVLLRGSTMAACPPARCRRPPRPAAAGLWPRRGARAVLKKN